MRDGTRDKVAPGDSAQTDEGSCKGPKVNSAEVIVSEF